MADNIIVTYKLDLIRMSDGSVAAMTTLWVMSGGLFFDSVGKTRVGVILPDEREFKVPGTVVRKTVAELKTRNNALRVSEGWQVIDTVTMVAHAMTELECNDQVDQWYLVAKAVTA